MPKKLKVFHVLGDPAEDLIGRIFKTKSGGVVWKVISEESTKNFLLENVYGSNSQKILRSLSCISDNFTEVDSGRDLIGRKITRGGSTKYTFESFNPETGNMKLSWHGGSDNFYTPESCRNYVKKGKWRFVPEETTISTVAQSAFDYFTTIGADIPALTVGDVRGYINNNRLGKFKACQLYEKIQAVYLTKNKVPPLNLGKNLQHQMYNAAIESYTTQPEEEIIMNKKQSITIKVSDAPFAIVPEFSTIYGTPADEMSEEQLLEALQHVDMEKRNLEDLKTGTESSRITSKLKVLSDARSNIIKALDALPEDDK